MIIQLAALAFAATAGTTTTAPPAPPPTTVSVTTLPTQPTTTGVTTTVPSGPTTTIPIPAGYTPLVDDSHTIVLAVPDAWQDVNTTAFIPEEGTAAEGQPSIVASPDIQQFYTSFGVPGVSYFAVPYVEDPLGLIMTYGLTAGCTSIEVKEYDDPVFVGYVQVGTDCGPLHMTWNMVTANPVGSQAFTAILQVQTADPAELETVLRTFNVAP
jgi:hypothetical protein